MSNIVTENSQLDELKKTINEIMHDLKPMLETVLATEDQLLNWTARASPDIQEDLKRYVFSDPAAKGSFELVDNAYAAFKAVAAYRVARAIADDDHEDNKLAASILPRYLSEKAKGRSGAEIHPGAKIGQRFVLDHGYNTVIGETCEIGNDVTILNNVVLGALWVSEGKKEKRHPIIGNNVNIAGNVRIFGRIKIEDGASLLSGVIIAGRGVAADTRIRLITKIQVEKGPEKKNLIRVYGVVPEEEPGVFTIYGCGLEDTEVILQICEWPKEATAWGRSIDCEAILEIARVGSDSENWCVQCPSHSGKMIRVHICAKPREVGSRVEIPPTLPSPIGHDINVRLILSSPDGRHIELETEELTHAVIGESQETSRASRS